MRYILLNMTFLIAILAWLNFGIRKRTSELSLLFKALLLTLIIMLTLTAVFDSIMIATGIFEYRDKYILRVYIWNAPIEDFIYSIASVFMVGLLWEYYGTKE